MRTVYLGTTDFASTVLRRLAASEHRPQLVVTRPDRPRGRGRRLESPPVAEAARELGIDVDQPESVNATDARERIAAANPSAVCICAYGGLIREPLLSGHEMYNVHPSLLPRWRGAAPIERAIEAGDRETGVSIMRPVAELDAGPVYLQQAAPITDDDDYGSLSARLAELAGELLVQALTTRPEPRQQPGDGMTYAEKIDREERRLDPARSPEAVARKVRALTPHVGAYVQIPGGERLGVRRAAPAPGISSPAPGELTATGGRLLFGVASGALELLAVQPAGGRPMPASDYLRGRSPALAGHGEQPGG
ncbi:MAG: methionyl-tRNA formyltransferase [Actinomycetota bacterium]|nr:methionyl-tRNA formyltransferase [Actinomycetota bacterium]